MALICCGRDSVGDSADATILRPVDPVSTWTWSMVWQLLLEPGAQTVTLVKTRSGMFAGPPSTVMACTFCVGWLDDEPATAAAAGEAKHGSQQERGPQAVHRRSDH